MCGIAGYFGTRQIDPERLQSCLRLMHHRGPDHAAYRVFSGPAERNAYLLHSRLSIIDLDPRSNQPFHVDQKWIVFNGELYNYKELRHDLENGGAAFHTQSDTEVLLNAIHRWGWANLERCEGMWAFAVYDEKDGTLTLSRDRFGEKPLYLYRDDSGLYFGSEIKFIAGLLSQPLEINVQHLYRFMVNGYRSLYKAPENFFKGISELPRASTLDITARGMETERSYWQPRFVQEEAMSHDQAVQGVRERLLRAVQLRLRADVPLAFCMSGGIDSNSLIGIAKRACSYDVHGFTIVNTDTRYEEQDMVRHAVKEYGIRHTEIPVRTEGFLENLRNMVAHHDAPVYTISYYSHWLLMKAISANGYRISISGTGADELFTGYYDHHLFYLYENRNDPDLHTESVKSWRQYIQPLVRNPYLTNPDVFVKNPRFRDHLYLDKDKFRQYLIHPWDEPFEENTYCTDQLRNRMLNEIFHESVPPILHEDDHNAMHFSLENRSPYLDKDLFEFSSRIPTRHLIRNGYTKVLLRDAMRDFVPDRILNSRRKVGFNAPIFSFLDVHRPEVRACLLDNSPIFEHVRRESIEALTQKEDLPNSESLFLFYFLCGKFFLEIFGSRLAATL